MDRTDHSPKSNRRYLEIAQRLLVSITSGELTTGSRLPGDRELASQYGVSRTTAREAMLALELVGAVEIQHGNGVFVRPAAGEALEGQGSTGLDALPRELIEARLHIEPMVAGLVASTISTDTTRMLRAELDEARTICHDDDHLPRYLELSFRFHSLLATECENRLVRSFASDLINAELHPLWELINQQASRTRTVRMTHVHEHSEILDALEHGDAQRAQSEMRRHLQTISKNLFFL